MIVFAPAYGTSLPASIPLPASSVNFDAKGALRVNECTASLAQAGPPPSPPAEKATASKDQAGQASTSDGARDCGRSEAHWAFYETLV